MRKLLNETSGNAPILSGQYRDWLNELKKRYRSLQVKAAVSVNSALIEFYWRLGKDISETYAKADFYGASFFRKLSADLQLEMPGEMGFSPRNIRYCVDFYEQYRELLQQPVAKVLICKGKNAPLVRYLLGKSDMPLGVSDYELTRVLPKDFRGSIPSVEELEAELERLGHDANAMPGKEKP